MSNLVPVEKLSKILDAIKTKLDTKLTATGIRNNADTTDSGYVLDARMGKSLGDRATTLETKISSLFFDTDSSGRWGFKTSRNGAVTSFTATGAASTIESSNLTGSRALASDGNGKVAVSSTTATELGYLHGVTGAVQTQINSLNSKASSHDSSINSLNSNLANSNSRIGSLESANNSRYTENGRINVYVGGDSKLHFVNRDGADTALNFSNASYKNLFKNVYSYYHESSSADDARIRVTNVDTGKYVTFISTSSATVFEDVSISYDGSAFSVKPADSSKTMIQQPYASSGVTVGTIYDSWMNHTNTRFALVRSTGFLFDRQ